MSDAGKGIRVLVVDDDDTFRGVMSAELSRRGYAVDAVAGGQAALAKAAASFPHVILLDMRLPDMDGIEVLRKLRQTEAKPGVVLLTGHGTIDAAIQAMRLGADDFLEKPCPFDKLEMTIQKTCDHKRLEERQRILEDGYANPDVDLHFVGSSGAFEKITAAISRIAPTDTTTLIHGETGVGKEMVARLIHAKSRRRDKPFVVVDCAALHEDLLQSEIFGHERGSFTGAARQKHGLFEVAHTGTIFLDEVGEMSLETQAKLLRVLETGRFRRLGGTQEISVDVRVLSATNRNLREMAGKGRFREDLYFRLAPLVVEIPPLRERPADIGTLVEYFIRQLNVRFGQTRVLSPEARSILLQYAWPGNVREVAHVLEQVMVLSDGATIEPGDLPPHLLAKPDGRVVGCCEGEPLPLREVERRHVLWVMEKAAGNRARAAQILGISERNLYRLLKRFASGSEAKS